MQNQPIIHGSAPNRFIHKHSASIIGILSGFDRLRLRGTLRQVYSPQVRWAYLNACPILIKDFGRLVERTSVAVKEKARALAAQAARPFVFVPSSQTSKEDCTHASPGLKDSIPLGLTNGLGALLKKSQRNGGADSHCSRFV